MTSHFLFYEILVVKQDGKILCVFSEENPHEKVLTEKITKAVSIYSKSAFPMLVKAILCDGDIELFTANKL